MPRRPPMLTSFFDRFLIGFGSQLRSPEPSKSFFPHEKLVFFKKIVVRSWDGFWMPFGFQLASKIHQNPFKIHSQEAFKNWSILASIFERFGLRFGNQVGTMLATFFASRRPKRPPRRPKMPYWNARCTLTLSLLSPKTPQDAPRSIFGGLLLDFCSIFDWFLIDFCSIFHRNFGWFFIDFWKIFGLPRFCVRLIVQRSPAVLPLCGLNIWW